MKLQIGILLLQVIYIIQSRELTNCNKKNSICNKNLQFPHHTDVRDSRAVLNHPLKCLPGLPCNKNQTRDLKNCGNTNSNCNGKQQFLNTEIHKETSIVTDQRQKCAPGLRCSANETKKVNNCNAEDGNCNGLYPIHMSENEVHINNCNSCHVRNVIKFCTEKIFRTRMCLTHLQEQDRNKYIFISRLINCRRYDKCISQYLHGGYRRKQYRCPFRYDLKTPGNCCMQQVCNSTRQNSNIEALTTNFEIFNISTETSQTVEDGIAASSTQLGDSTVRRTPSSDGSIISTPFSETLVVKSSGVSEYGESKEILSSSTATSQADEINSSNGIVSTTPLSFSIFDEVTAEETTIAVETTSSNRYSPPVINNEKSSTSTPSMFENITLNPLETVSSTTSSIKISSTDESTTTKPPLTNEVTIPDEPVFTTIHNLVSTNQENTQATSTVVSATPSQRDLSLGSKSDSFMTSGGTETLTTVESNISAGSTWIGKGSTDRSSESSTTSTPSTPTVDMKTPSVLEFTALNEKTSWSTTTSQEGEINSSNEVPSSASSMTSNRTVTQISGFTKKSQSPIGLTNGYVSPININETSSTSMIENNTLNPTARTIFTASSTKIFAPIDETRITTQPSTPNDFIDMNSSFSISGDNLIIGASNTIESVISSQIYSSLVTNYEIPSVNTESKTSNKVKFTTAGSSVHIGYSTTSKRSDESTLSSTLDLVGLNRTNGIPSITPSPTGEEIVTETSDFTKKSSSTIGLISESMFSSTPLDKVTTVESTVAVETSSVYKNSFPTTNKEASSTSTIHKMENVTLNFTVPNSLGSTSTDASVSTDGSISTEASFSNDLQSSSGTRSTSESTLTPTITDEAERLVSTDVVEISTTKGFSIPTINNDTSLFSIPLNFTEPIIFTSTSPTISSTTQDSIPRENEIVSSPPDNLISTDHNSTTELSKEASLLVTSPTQIADSAITKTLRSSKMSTISTPLRTTLVAETPKISESAVVTATTSSSEMNEVNKTDAILSITPSTTREKGVTEISDFTKKSSNTIGLISESVFSSTPLDKVTTVESTVTVETSSIHKNNFPTINEETSSASTIYKTEDTILNVTVPTNLSSTSTEASVPTDVVETSTINEYTVPTINNETSSTSTSPNFTAPIMFTSSSPKISSTTQESIPEENKIVSSPPTDLISTEYNSTTQRPNETSLLVTSSMQPADSATTETLRSSKRSTISTPLSTTLVTETPKISEFAVVTETISSSEMNEVNKTDAILSITPSTTGEKSVTEISDFTKKSSSTIGLISESVFSSTPLDKIITTESTVAVETSSVHKNNFPTINEETSSASTIYKTEDTILNVTVPTNLSSTSTEASVPTDVVKTSIINEHTVPTINNAISSTSTPPHFTAPIIFTSSSLKISSTTQESIPEENKIVSSPPTDLISTEYNSTTQRPNETSLLVTSSMQIADSATTETLSSKRSTISTPLNTTLVTETPKISKSAVVTETISSSEMNEVNKTDASLSIAPSTTGEKSVTEISDFTKKSSSTIGLISESVFSSTPLDKVTTVESTVTVETSSVHRNNFPTINVETSSASTIYKTEDTILNFTVPTNLSSTFTEASVPTDVVETSTINEYTVSTINNETSSTSTSPNFTAPIMFTSSSLKISSMTQESIPEENKIVSSPPTDLISTEYNSTTEQPNETSLLVTSSTQIADSITTETSRSSRRSTISTPFSTTLVVQTQKISESTVASEIISSSITASRMNEVKSTNEIPSITPSTTDEEIVTEISDFTTKSSSTVGLTRESVFSSTPLDKVTTVTVETSSVHQNSFPIINKEASSTSTNYRVENITLNFTVPINLSSTSTEGSVSTDRSISTEQSVLNDLQSFSGTRSTSKSTHIPIITDEVVPLVSIDVVNTSTTNEYTVPTINNEISSTSTLPNFTAPIIFTSSSPKISYTTQESIPEENKIVSSHPTDLISTEYNSTTERPNETFLLVTSSIQMADSATTETLRSSKRSTISTPHSTTLVAETPKISESTVASEIISSSITASGMNEVNSTDEIPSIMPFTTGEEIVTEISDFTTKSVRYGTVGLTSEPMFSSTLLDKVTTTETSSVHKNSYPIIGKEASSTSTNYRMENITLNFTVPVHLSSTLTEASVLTDESISTIPSVSNDPTPSKADLPLTTTGSFVSSNISSTRETLSTLKPSTVVSSAQIGESTTSKILSLNTSTGLTSLGESLMTEPPNISELTILNHIVSPSITTSDLEEVNKTSEIDFTTLSSTRKRGATETSSTNNSNDGLLDMLGTTESVPTIFIKESSSESTHTPMITDEVEPLVLTEVVEMSTTIEYNVTTINNETSSTSIPLNFTAATNFIPSSPTMQESILTDNEIVSSLSSPANLISTEYNLTTKGPNETSLLVTSSTQIADSATTKPLRNSNGSTPLASFSTTIVAETISSSITATGTNEVKSTNEIPSITPSTTGKEILTEISDFTKKSSSMIGLISESVFSSTSLDKVTTVESTVAVETSSVHKNNFPTTDEEASSSSTIYKTKDIINSTVPINLSSTSTETSASIDGIISTEPSVSNDLQSSSGIRSKSESTYIPTITDEVVPLVSTDVVETLITNEYSVPTINNKAPSTSTPLNFTALIMFTSSSSKISSTTQEGIPTENEIVSSPPTGLILTVYNSTTERPKETSSSTQITDSATTETLRSSKRSTNSALFSTTLVAEASKMFESTGVTKSISSSITASKMNEVNSTDEIFSITPSTTGEEVVTEISEFTKNSSSTSEPMFSSTLLDKVTTVETSSVHKNNFPIIDTEASSTSTNYRMENTTLNFTVPSNLSLISTETSVPIDEIIFTEPPVSNDLISAGLTLTANSSNVGSARETSNTLKFSTVVSSTKIEESTTSNTLSLDTSTVLISLGETLMMERSNISEMTISPSITSVDLEEVNTTSEIHVTTISSTSIRSARETSSTNNLNHGLLDMLETTESVPTIFIKEPSNGTRSASESTLPSMITDDIKPLVSTVVVETSTTKEYSVPIINNETSSASTILSSSAKISSTTHESIPTENKIASSSTTNLISTEYNSTMEQSNKTSLLVTRSTLIADSATTKPLRSLKSSTISPLFNTTLEAETPKIFESTVVTGINNSSSTGASELNVVNSTDEISSIVPSTIGLVKESMFSSTPFDKVTTAESTVVDTSSVHESSISTINNEIYFISPKSTVANVAPNSFTSSKTVTSATTDKIIVTEASTTDEQDSTGITVESVTPTKTDLSLNTQSEVFNVRTASEISKTALIMETSSVSEFSISSDVTSSLVTASTSPEEIETEPIFSPKVTDEVKTVESITAERSSVPIEIVSLSTIIPKTSHVSEHVNGNTSDSISKFDSLNTNQSISSSDLIVRTSTFISETSNTNTDVTKKMSNTLPNNLDEIASSEQVTRTTIDGSTNVVSNTFHENDSVVREPTTVSPPVFQCPGVGQYPDSSDCRKFHLCKPIISVVIDVKKICPKGSLYDPQRKECTTRQVQCAFKHILSCDKAGTFEHPNDCNKYYACVWSSTQDGYIGKEYRCPSRHKFSAKRKLCVPCKTCDTSKTTNSIVASNPVGDIISNIFGTGQTKQNNFFAILNNVAINIITNSSVLAAPCTRNCGEKNPALPAFTCPDIGKHPDPSDCGKFYLCKNSPSGIRDVKRSCRNGTFYDAYKRKCTTNPIQCPWRDQLICNEEGTFAHPTKCNEYYECVRNRTNNEYQSKQYRCPPSYKFSDKAKLCLLSKTCQSLPKTSISTNPTTEVLGSSEISSEYVPI